MAACIHVFLHVLEKPSWSSIQPLISLLDMCAGHFARLDLCTSSEFRLSLPREIAACARTFCEQSNEGDSTVRRTGVSTPPDVSGSAFIPNDLEFDLWSGDSTVSQ